MVRRTCSTHRAAVAATLLMAAAAAGCARTMHGGIPMAGFERTRAEAPRVTKTPPVRTSVYEHTPAFTWNRWAIGQPASPAAFFTQADGPLGHCLPVSQGLMRVLPIAGGAPARPIQRIGPFALGVAGYGIEGLTEIWAMNTFGLAAAAMQQTARRATMGGCDRGLFAFVSIGTDSALDPVVVR